MQIRDRIKELRRVRASELRPHPRNWRTHPPGQQAALQGALAEIGYADALLARELEDGSLQLVDGHLRAQTTPDSIVPVLILDLDDAEALKLLAILDPLAGMAGADPELVHKLISDISTESDALQSLLNDTAVAHPVLASSQEKPEPIIPTTYQVVVECEDEDQQQSLYERLKSEGHRCRVLSL